MTVRQRGTSSDTSRRNFVFAGACVLGSVATGAMTPVWAHHGWGTFDTRHAYYVTGTLGRVRWGNPHSEAILKLDAGALPANWLQRPLPEGANERDGRLTMASARPYTGRHKELELVLAGPDWMARWGLKRPLKTGEKMEAVGFLNAGEGDHLRPVMFWLSDGQGVWQQLTAFPNQPEPVSTR